MLFRSVIEDTFANWINPDDPNELDNNNYKARAIDIIGPIVLKPDLQVVDVTAAPAGSVDTPFSVSWTVENHGEGDTSGDWYDTVRASPDRLVVIVGDVVGRGVRAATAAGNLRAATQALAPTRSPAEVLDELDRMATGDHTLFGTSMLCLRIDMGAGRLEWANADRKSTRLNSSH